LHSKDYSLLLDLQIFFGGVGSVIKKTKPAVTYSVSSIKDLTNIIIPHFDNFPLLSKKAADFILFKQIIELMRNKAHLTREGIQEILKIKASMNLGLSDAVKYEFSSITPIIRPLIITTKIQNPN
jgi:LAGLIDADG endonuclease